MDSLSNLKSYKTSFSKNVQECCSLYTLVNQCMFPWKCCLQVSVLNKVIILFDIYQGYENQTSWFNHEPASCLVQNKYITGVQSNHKTGYKPLEPVSPVSTGCLKMFKTDLTCYLLLRLKVAICF